MRRTSPSRLRICGPDKSSQAPSSVILLASQIQPSVPTGLSISATNAVSKSEMRSLDAALIFSPFFFQVFAVLDTQAQRSSDRQIPALMEFANADNLTEPKLYKRGVPELIEFGEPLKTGPGKSTNVATHPQAAVQANQQAKDSFPVDKVEEWTDADSEAPETLTFSGSEADSSDLAQTPDVKTNEGPYFEQNRLSEVPSEEGSDQQREPEIEDTHSRNSRRLSIKDRIRNLMAAENSEPKRTVEAIPSDTWTTAKVAELVNSFEGRSKAGTNRAEHVQKYQSIPSREKVKHLLDQYEDNTKSPSQSFIGPVYTNRLDEIDEDVPAMDPGLVEDPSSVREELRPLEQDQGSTFQPEAITMKAPELIPAVSDNNALEPHERNPLAETRGRYENSMLPVTEAGNKFSTQETKLADPDNGKVSKVADSANDIEPLIKHSVPEGEEAPGNIEGSNKVSELAIDWTTPTSPQEAISAKFSGSHDKENPMKASFPNENDAANELHQFPSQLDVQGKISDQDKMSPGGLVGTAALNTEKEVLSSLARKFQDALDGKLDQRKEANKRPWQKVVEWIRAPMSIPLGRGKMKDAELSKNNISEDKIPKFERELIAGQQSFPESNPQSSPSSSMKGDLHNSNNNQDNLVSQSSDDSEDDVSQKDQGFGASGSLQGREDQPPPASNLQKTDTSPIGILKKNKPPGPHRVSWKDLKDAIRSSDVESSVTMDSELETPHTESRKVSGYKERSDLNQDEHLSDNLWEANAQNEPVDSELQGVKYSRYQDDFDHPIYHRSKSDVGRSFVTRLEDQEAVDFTPKKQVLVDNAKRSQISGGLRRSKSADQFQPLAPTPEQHEEMKNTFLARLWSTSYQALSSIQKAAEKITQKCTEYKESFAEKLMRLGPHRHSVLKHQNGDIKTALNDQDIASEPPGSPNGLPDEEDFAFDELRPFVHTRARSFSNFYELEREFSEIESNSRMDQGNKEHPKSWRHQLDEAISPHETGLHADLPSNYVNSEPKSDPFNSFKDSLPKVHTKVLDRSKSCISRTHKRPATSRGKRKYPKTVSFREFDLHDRKGNFFSQPSTPKAMGDRNKRTRLDFTIPFTRVKDSEALLAKLASLETGVDSSSRAPQESMPYYAKKAFILRGRKPERSHLNPLKGLQILKPKSGNDKEYQPPQKMKEASKLLKIEEFMRKIQALSRYWIMPLLLPQPALKANMLCSILPLSRLALQPASPDRNLNAK